MNAAKISTLIVLASIAGCTRTSNSGGSSSAIQQKKADPWAAVIVELGRTPDVATARRVIGQLNGDLSNANQTLPTFAADAIAKCTPLLSPGPDEARDWTSATFTSMDANYLGESLYFDAVADSLGVKHLPADQQAAEAFRWVCRQVYDRPWVIANREQKIILPPVPPQFVLKRGYGVGVDREYVFLALARQLGLDAVLVGPPGGERKPRVLRDGKGDNRGPFWAVGVRIGDDVLLYDPWAATVIPQTLSAAKTNPKPVLEALNANKTLIAVTADDVTNAVTYLTVPVNAVPPRMKRLEDKLATDLSVKLAVNPDEMTARCAKFPGGPSKWYGPPVEVDPYAVPHVLGSFLPTADGGYDTRRPDDGQLAFLLLQIEPVSGALFVIPPALSSATARQNFNLRCITIYKRNIVDRDFREKIQRGEFNDAIKQLHELDRFFATQRERQRDPQVFKAEQEWYAQANKAYDELSLASLPENIGKKTFAEADVDALWKNNEAASTAVQATVAQAGTLDIGYWLALAKHEQAVRSQIRYRRAAAVNADADRIKAAGDWAVAHDEWTRFLAIVTPQQQLAHPGRAEHAKNLASRAAALMANPDSP